MKKKVIIIIAVCALLLSVLTACAHKAKCDFCGKEKYCTTKSVLGEEVDICDDCLSSIKGN